MKKLCLLFLVGCHTPVDVTPVPRPAPAPAKRVLIEWTYADFGIRIGDAVITPEARILVFVAARDDLSIDVRVRETAVVGETVEAEIHVAGDPGHRYRITIQSEQSDVTLLSPAQHTVWGGSTIPVRFTRTKEGKGKLSVRAVRED